MKTDLACQKKLNRVRRAAGFTLLEILIVIATLSSVAAMGFMGFSNTSHAVKESKLRQDVAALNRAVNTYLMSGGDLSKAKQGTEVIAKLKTTIQAAERSSMAGLRSSMVDLRLSGVPASGSGPRAVWDTSKKSFVLAERGEGFQEFVLDPGAVPTAPSEESRATVMKLNSSDKWIWGFNEQASKPQGPNTPPVTDTGDTPAVLKPDRLIQQLAPPTFSVTGGKYALTWFPRDLVLSPAGTTPANGSEIFYIISGGAWQKYTGPFSISEPGIAVTAKSVSLNLDSYSDSEEAGALYFTTPVPLDPSTSLQSSYTYAQLGGPLAPGSPAPALAPAVRLFLTNANDIPDVFERDSVFQSFWTWDGSSPAAPGLGRYSGSNSFSNGYPGDSLDLTVASFAGKNTLTLKYATLSKNSQIVLSSGVKTATTSISTTRLLPPLISPGQTSLTNAEKVTLTLDVSNAGTPLNARIYYRTDGEDPGDVNGEPAAGATLYTGPVQLESTDRSTVNLVARVYPPSAFKSWFTTSLPFSQNYYLPYAGGNVYAVTGGDRNIYSLNPSTGENQVIDATAAFPLRSLALDTERARLYYVEDATGAAGWRLGYYDFISAKHAVVGNLKSNWSYTTSSPPPNLVFFNKALYFLPASSDDLVRITLNEEASAITSVSKAADLRSSKNWSKVGDLAVDETGLLFFVDSDKKYHRFDLLSLSGYLELGSTNDFVSGLAFYQGRLFGTKDKATDIQNLAPSSGKTLSSIKAANAKKFIDLASPSPAAPVPVTKSLWAVDNQADGPHLIEFRNNYRSPLTSTAVDYGVILADGKAIPPNDRYGIRGLAISSSGVAYFVHNTRIKVGGKDQVRPLMSLNLSQLKLGDELEVTGLGDLAPGLKIIAGSIDPDDIVTGVTLSPSGGLHGVLQEGAASGPGSADYLFKCTQPASTMTGATIGVASLGRTSSASGLSSDSEDLVFTRDGRLLVLDGFDNELLEISPENGSVLSVRSKGPGNYHGIAVDYEDSRIIASDVGGSSTPDTFLMLHGGTNNAEYFLNYRDRWGYTSLEAISFFQSPFLLQGNQLDIFAADGTPTIHGLNLSTGQTIPVTDAPWPVRALAFDLLNREVFYLRGGSASFTLGSFNRDTYVHKVYGDLKTPGFQYVPSQLPDNLMYFSSSLWYVEPGTDNLVRIEVGNDAITSQKKAFSITGGTMRFDLIGDLAMTQDGWVYFSCIRSDGQRFCRFNINSLSRFEVLSGPTPPPVLYADGGPYRETWFDALAFSPPNASGTQALYCAYPSAPSPLHTVNPIKGTTTFARNVTPRLGLIDFSDQHPGVIGDPHTVALRPLLKINNLQASYTYAEVGGPFLAGANPPPPADPGPMVVLNNPSELLVSQQNSDHFQVRWSYDAVDPRTSPNASVTGAFADGFPGQQLSISWNLWGNRSALPLRVVAKSLKTNVMGDSPVLQPVIVPERMILDSPLITEVAAVNGVRQVQIAPNIAGGSIPPGTRIYYTTDGTDPGVLRDANGLDNAASGKLYTGTIPVPATLPNGDTHYTITARLYPPTNLGQWFAASVDDYLDVPMGLIGGHMDVDTASLLYPFRKGSTDAHVHEYDKKYNAVGASFFGFAGTSLRNLPRNVPAGTRFKIIVANAELSPGGRLVVNKTYDPNDKNTWTPVTTYDNTLPSALPVYSLEGLPGTTRLSQFGLYFNTDAIGSGGLHPTVTGQVRSNTPGRKGEWRNGAITIQVVKVNPDGSDAFTVNTALSNGGVQGVATSGLLWEATFFYHTSGGPYAN